MRRATAAALRSPLALFELPRRSWGYFALYLGLAAALMVGAAFAFDAYSEELKATIYRFVFPESWHLAVDLLIGYFFSEETRLLAINLVIQASLQLVTLTLFPVKEALSSSYEGEARLVDEEQKEHPLWKQGLQELQYLLLFVGVYGLVFLIGREGGPWRRVIAMVLSYSWLYFTYAVDFVAPLFQRHEGHYSEIYKTLLVRLPAALIFGAIFAAPSMVAAALWAKHPEWDLPLALGVVFGANVIGVAWAAVSGTYLASVLYPVFRARERSHLLVRWGGSLALTAALAAVGYLYWGIGTVLYHKSQILKCRYGVDLASARFRRPTLLTLVTKRAELGLGVDVEIENPTGVDVAIENNRIEILHDGKKVGDARLEPLTVEAGQTRTVPLDLELGVTGEAWSQGMDLLSTEGWTIVLYVEVVPGYEFPIALLGERTP
jgi:hypothetical protein